MPKGVYNHKSPSKETREKMSRSRLGKKHSAETLIKLSAWQKGKKRKPLPIKTRIKISEALRGENNYLWRGGKNKLGYPVDWTRTLRISIRERDKYTCQICGEKQGDEAHSVHHIDYNKHNCNPNNLISLCRPCHTKTGVNREYWIDYFKKDDNQTRVYQGCY